MGQGTHTLMMLGKVVPYRSLSYELVVEPDYLDVINGYAALGMENSVRPQLAINIIGYRELGIVSLNHLLPVEQPGNMTL